MLEKCNNLIECEQILSKKIEDISLLGQIALSDHDLHKLGNLIAQHTIIDPQRAMAFPACLSCFMVWLGIHRYKAGDYWSAVHQVAGLPEGVNWSMRWGEAFLRYLRRMSLPTFAYVSGHRYVTPILAHGGIPDYCLEDFFQYLLFPIVSGRLEVDISDTEEIIQEWQDRSSLFMFADKPVRRFLLYGGKEAMDFLSRCIEMAQRAYGEGQVPPPEDLDLPFRVVERFEEWWHSQRDRVHIKRQVRSRFRRPVIFLLPEFGEVCLNIPQQQIRLESGLNSVGIEIIAGRANLPRQPLSVYKQNSLMESEEMQISLCLPAEIYEVRLLGGDRQKLRMWSLRGLSKARPWMAFEMSTKRVIHNEELSRAPVWLVFPGNFSMRPDVRILEDGQPFYGMWAQYRSYLIDLSSVEILHLLDAEGNRFEIPVSSAVEHKPELCEEERVPHVLCEGDPVFKTPPDLRISISDKMSRWRLSVVPRGRSTLEDRIDCNLADLVANREGELDFQISLSDERLLGAYAVGRFSVHIRGPLGKNYQLHFAVLPDLEVRFSQPIYVPTLDKASEVGLSLTCESIGNIRVEPPCENLKQHEDGWLIKAPDTESIINCLTTLELPYDRLEEVPLKIRVPRLRIAIQGLGSQPMWQWTHTIQEISLEQWEESKEIFLLVDVPCEDGYMSLTLQNTDQVYTQRIHRGKARFELRRFSDTLKSLGKSLSMFYLKLESRDFSTQDVPVLAVHTDWIVEGLRVTEEVSDEQRKVVLMWTDKGRIRNRIARLWNLWCPWVPPLECDIYDDRSDVTVEHPILKFPPGRYRIEFAVDDPWRRSLPLGSPPEVNGRTVFDETIGSIDEQVVYRSQLQETFLGNLVEIGIYHLRIRERRTYNDGVKNEIERCFVNRPSTSEDLYALASLLIDWISCYKRHKHVGNIAHRYVAALWNHVFENAADTLLSLKFLYALAEYVKDKGDERVEELARQLACILGFVQLSLGDYVDYVTSVSDIDSIWDLWLPLGLSIDLAVDQNMEQELFTQRLLRTLGEEPLKKILQWPSQTAEELEWPENCSGEFSECMLCCLCGDRKCDVGIGLSYNPEYYGGSEIENLDLLIAKDKEEIKQISDFLELHPVGLLHADAYINGIMRWLYDMRVNDLYMSIRKWVNEHLLECQAVIGEISKLGIIRPLANAVKKRSAAERQNVVCNVPFVIGAIALVQSLMAWGLYSDQESEKWKSQGIKAYQFAREIYEHDLCLFNVSLCMIIRQVRVRRGQNHEF